MAGKRRPVTLVRKDGTTSVSWGSRSGEPAGIVLANPDVRAEQIRTQLQDQFPYLAQDIFAEAIHRYARAEARSQLLYDYVMSNFPDVKPFLLQALAQAEANAAKFGQDCGLDPAGHAKLAKDLGWAKRLGQEAVSGLSEVGRALRANREIAG